MKRRLLQLQMLLLFHLMLDYHRGLQLQMLLRLLRLMLLMTHQPLKWLML